MPTHCVRWKFPHDLVLTSKYLPATTNTMRDVNGYLQRMQHLRQSLVKMVWFRGATVTISFRGPLHRTANAAR